FNSCGVRWVPEGSVLLTSRASIGHVAIAGVRLTTNQGFASFIVHQEVEAKYIAWWLLSAKDHLNELAKGTTFKEISKSALRELLVPLPPLAEQRRIVAAIERHLTRLDAVVETLRRDRVKLKNARAALLRDAVEGKLTERWRATHPVAEDGEALLRRILAERRARWEAGQLERMRARGQEPRDDRWKQSYREPAGPDTSTLPPLPPGWCWATVEQVGDVQLGRQRSPKHHTGPYMRPYLRVANVFEDKIDTSDVMMMNFDPSEFEVYHLRYGDILLNEGQSLELLGRAAIYRGEVPGACFQNTLLRFRTWDGGLLPEYALLVFRAYMYSKRFQKIGKHTTNIAHLGAGRFAALEFPLPPLEEQRQIVAEVERRLTIIQQVEEAIERSLKRAERLRQSILKRAFSGQLVPQDPRDEPASQLLERIQAERARRQHEKEGRRPGQRRSGVGAGPSSLSLAEGGPGGLVDLTPQPPEPLDPQQIARPSLWEEAPEQE
ncbi:MAG: restriction endonuclease subunit S, partial [Thermogemmatispora sp.]|uniref:restriction endonuclease subunit S n=1 Tax=Thermogemmatispora sp. TaxID=1968838 RepID=UPI002630E84F